MAEKDKEKAAEDKKKTKDLNDPATADVLHADPGYWKDLAQKHQEWQDGSYSRAIMRGEVEPEGISEEDIIFSTEEKITSEGEKKHKETKKTPVPKKETSHTNTGAAEETSYYKGKEKERKNRYVSKGSVGRIG
jgi:hypothetical protein